jgi:DNA-directed RNA polymerase specialized sigma24 family protein
LQSPAEKITASFPVLPAPPDLQDRTTNSSKRRQKLTDETDLEVAEPGDPDDIPPLTRNSYRRRPEALAQIRALLPLSRDEFLDRARIKEGELGFVEPEAIVFFIRRHRLDNDRRMSGTLLTVLRERCLPVLENGVRGFDAETRKDLIQEILEELIRRLTAKDDRGDFAQVRFWMFLKRIRLTACSRQIDYLQGIEQLDECQAESVAADRDYQLSPEQFAQLAQGLEALPSLLRRVFIMRYRDSWKVGPEDRSKEDPNDPSLAAHFNKTPRTIQNWLGRADKILQNFYREEKS